MNILPNGCPVIYLSPGVAQALQNSIEEPNDPLAKLLDRRGDTSEYTAVPITKAELDRVLIEFVQWYVYENTFILRASLFDQLKELRQYFKCEDATDEFV